MNITITGNLGSGKTSVCKELKKNGFTVISAGDIFRDIASEKGMTVIELNEAAKNDRRIDDLLDHRSTELGKKMDHTVFDSRLAWHFVEKSFKVFLLVDTQEAARRVFAGTQRSAEEYQNVDEARAGLEARANLEQARFKELYGLDYYDASNYDLIIESSFATPEQIAQEIQKYFEQYQAQPFTAKVVLNLKSLYPSKKLEEISSQISMDDGFRIVIKDGYNYIVNGCHRALAALADGKVFAQIEEIRTDEAAQEKIMLLSLDDIEYFEQEGNFHYRENPVQKPVKPGYMVDFTKVFG